MIKETLIHPSAVVSPKAMIGKDVSIGPFSVITDNVKIGDGTKVGPNCFIDGWTTIGQNCEITYGVVIGTAPQDFKYKGLESYVEIGDNNKIREYVTIHRANTEKESTKIGNNNMLMSYVHIAHNCKLGNEIVIANSVNLAGHVEIDDQAVLGGMAGFHQFIKIGRLAMIGGYARVVKDIPPFVIAAGQKIRLYGLNSRGLIRRNFSSQLRKDLKTAYNYMTHSKYNLSKAIEEIRKNIPKSPEMDYFLNFIENPSKMGMLTRGCNSKVKSAE